MPAPSTGILDSFDRPDESPAIGWIDSIDGTVYGGVKVLSNQLAPISGDSFSYYNTSYAANQEHFVTIATAATVSLYCRLNPIATAAVNGYELEVATGLGRWRIKRMDAGVSTQLGADRSQAFTAGDAAWLECIGSNITAYYKAAGGSWASVGTESDATYNQAGYLGHYIDQATRRLDDFGGGAVVVTTQGWPGVDSLGFPSKQRAPMPMIAGPREDRIMSMQSRQKG